MNHSRDERGMTTAEYAVGTVGAACIGCIVIRLADDPGWLTAIFQQLQHVLMRLDIDVNVPWRTLM